MTKKPLIQLIVAAVLMASGIGLAQSDPNGNTLSTDPNAVELELNFQDAPLQTIVEYLSEKAGIVILSDNGLDQRITVISRQTLNLDEAIALINSILKESGHAAVRTGRILRVVTLDQAKTMNIPVTAGADPDLIEAGDDMITHVIPVRFANAANLKENLAALLPDYASMEANEETNSLIVTDTTANIKRMMEIIRAMDTHITAVSEIRVFHLNQAEAASTAELINTIFQPDQGQSTRGGQGGQTRSPFEFLRQRFGGGTPGRGGGDRGGRGGDRNNQISVAPASRVSAAADERTNSVVVSASAEMMALVEKVITALDTRAAEVAEVKVFHLQYADAENTAELINEVFGLESRGGSRSTSGRGGGTPTAFRGFGGRGGGGGGGGGGTPSASSVEVVAAADQRTNSLVVSGPAETLVVIAEIVAELDANPEQERNLFIYPLKNANAANLMEILNNLFEEIQALNQQGAGINAQSFQGGGRGGGGPGGGGGGGGGTGGGGTGSGTSSDLDEETYFEADIETNSLLIMTSSKNYEKLKPIIAKLDEPVGQVLIKVLFAEITHSDKVDFGTEFSMLNLNNHGSTQSIQIFGNPLPLTTVAGVSSPTGLAVRTLYDDVDITIRALQETGKLNVLSRPYVLTRNNQLATITVAQEIPIPDSSTTVAGQTSVDLTYREDIGIVLEVTPSINPDGLVNMLVNAKITTRQAEKVQISESLSAEAFSTRGAITQVAVLDGQTIVIGGLIEDQLSETIKQVPLLGSLPIVGNLFKRTETLKSKTELLIFLTPHVAKVAEELTAISNTDRIRSTLNTDAVGGELFKKHMDDMQPGAVKDEDDD